MLIKIAADALRTQATALRTQADALDAQADLLERVETSSGFYSTRGEIPSGITRARFNRVVKTMAEAEADGRGWRIAKDVWHRNRARAKAPVLVAPNAPESSVDDMLSGAGLRATRLRVVGCAR